MELGREPRLTGSDAGLPNLDCGARSVAAGQHIRGKWNGSHGKAADRPVGAPRARASAVSESVHHRRDACRVCGHVLDTFLSLGPQPLANAFLQSREEFSEERLFPLDVAFCPECGLVQLIDVIDAEELFRDYIYLTGTSSTIREHYRRYVDELSEVLELSPDDLVLEVASNDGTLLLQFQELGVRTLGIEPARNVAERAREAGVETLELFFEEDTAARVAESHGRPRLVVANNVLAHVEDPVSFLRGVALLLEEDGLCTVEVPYLGVLLDRLEYDTIYHEHRSYFSVTSLLRLYQEAGLAVRRIDRLSIHGGSLRVYAGLREGGREHAGAVRRMAAREREEGLMRSERFRAFSEEVRRHRERLRTCLTGLRDGPGSLAAYGAPAKGNILLNYCDVGRDLIPYTVDRNELKVGTFTPGTHIPVRPVSALGERSPDHLLILPWNFADEIMRQQSDHVDRGGDFVLPIPQPKVVRT